MAGLLWLLGLASVLRLGGAGVGSDAGAISRRSAFPRARCGELASVVRSPLKARRAEASMRSDQPWSPYSEATCAKPITFSHGHVGGSYPIIEVLLAMRVCAANQVRTKPRFTG